MSTNERSTMIRIPLTDVRIYVQHIPGAHTPLWASGPYYQRDNPRYGHATHRQWRFGCGSFRLGLVMP